VMPASSSSPVMSQMEHQITDGADQLERHSCPLLLGDEQFLSHMILRSMNCSREHDPSSKPVAGLCYPEMRGREPRCAGRRSNIWEVSKYIYKKDARKVYISSENCIFVLKSLKIQI